MAGFLGRSPDAATAEDLRLFQLHSTATHVRPPTINMTVSAAGIWPRRPSAITSAVKTLAGFLGRSPDAATAEDLRLFQLHSTATHVRPPTINMTVSALRFFFGVTLDRADATRHLTFVHEPHKLPVVLSPDEVARLLEAAPGVKYKAALGVEKDPDDRVREALLLVFSKFDELRSARQVHFWLREEGIVLPANSRRAEAPGVVWKLPAYNAVHNILTNPIYAGAYAFGRTGSQVSVVEGRKHIRRGVRHPIAEWDVLLKEQHEGYITWDEFERNQRLIADNATGMGRTIARGAVRRQGEVLLAGLLRCGHCGRKLQVHYSGKLGR
ncbi:recombinase family protein [Methylosinus sp. PW1]|uniref:recombinase family protein n=1 Tax=Methylosinus sp. PW1 TaxID=107636 RepID=UPI00068BDAB9|nr:recombinase family protein [Methylosinus sp. PW1]